jgi:predicted transcriptional regulator
LILKGFQKRSNFDIAIDILETCLKGSLKTRIIYETNINSQLFEKYTKRLIDNGFLSKEENKFETTEKGKYLLKNAKETRRLLSNY